MYDYGDFFGLGGNFSRKEKTKNIKFETWRLSKKIFSEN